jgi:putative Holliday junction resolvase
VRAVGIDLGTKRIGVAVSDPSGTIATPYEVVQRSGERARDHRRLAELIEEAGATVAVVGLPLSLDGTSGPAALAIGEEVEELRQALPVPVELADERLTTVTAHRALAAGGMREKQRRSRVDKVAAAVLLQAWLDRRANT